MRNLALQQNPTARVPASSGLNRNRANNRASPTNSNRGGPSGHAVPGAGQGKPTSVTAGPSTGADSREDTTQQAPYDPAQGHRDYSISLPGSSPSGSISEGGDSGLTGFTADGRYDYSVGVNVGQPIRSESPYHPGREAGGSGYPFNSGSVGEGVSSSLVSPIHRPFVYLHPISSSSP